MKKTILLFLIIILTGCQLSNKKVIDEYYLTYNDNDIRLNTLFSNTFSTIGEYLNYRIEESSISNNTSNHYEYTNFEIETYFDNNIEKIAAITLTDENIQTTESVRIYDSKEKMINVYGDGYQKIGNIYIYKQKDTNLSFTLENDIIVNIRYYIE